ncbi:unnamed protein product [Sympodiomycopsis kandeliae]
MSHQEATIKESREEIIHHHFCPCDCFSRFVALHYTVPVVMSLAGIVVFTRHGDRKGFYQNPKTYSAVQTNLTVLGYLQEYQNGVDLRNLYLTNNADSIQGIDPTQAETKQLNVLADGGGEGGVIIESANALLQGLYPPYNDTLTLANGTTVSWDSGRAQLIPIETVEPDQDVWMEGWTECNAWTNYLSSWYESNDFKDQATKADAFYKDIEPILGSGRPLTLENGYNIFDFMNVEYIHNSTLSPQIAPHLATARYWANYHEAGAFGSKDPDNIANIAGQAFLPPLLDGIHQIANSSTGLKVQYLAASYKPFLGLFNMMQMPAPLSTDLVDYASTGIFEVRTDNTVTFRFRNGTDGDFSPMNIFGTSSPTMSISDFTNRLQPYSLDSLAKWCDKCSTAEARGCDVLARLNGTGGGQMEYAPDTSTVGRHHVSPVVAGLIGALVSLAVASVLLAIWLFLGGMARRSRNANSNRRAVNTAGLAAGGASGAQTPGPGSSGFELGSRASLPETAHSDGGSLSHAPDAKHID